MNKSVWEKTIRENANEETVGLRNRCKGEVCPEEGKDVSTVKRRKRRGEEICKGAVTKRIHSAIKVTTNGAGILCREERQ